MLSNTWMWLGYVVAPPARPPQTRPAPPLPMDANNNNDVDDDVIIDEDNLEMFCSRAEVEAVNRNKNRKEMMLDFIRLSAQRSSSDTSYYSCSEPEVLPETTSGGVAHRNAAIPKDLSFIDVAALQTPVKDAPRRSFSTADLFDPDQDRQRSHALRCQSVDDAPAPTASASSILPPLSNLNLTQFNDRYACLFFINIFHFRLTSGVDFRY